LLLEPNRPPPDALLGANAPALLAPNAPVLLEPNELAVFEPNNDGLLAVVEEPNNPPEVAGFDPKRPPLVFPVFPAFPKLGVLAVLDEPNRPPPAGLLPKALVPVAAPPPNGEFVLAPPPILI
jgi:hypothetical protein